MVRACVSMRSAVSCDHVFSYVVQPVVFSYVVWSLIEHDIPTGVFIRRPARPEGGDCALRPLPQADLRERVGLDASNGVRLCVHRDETVDRVPIQLRELMLLRDVCPLDDVATALAEEHSLCAVSSTAGSCGHRSLRSCYAGRRSAAGTGLIVHSVDIPRPARVVPALR
jgi:hypothetical protein